MIKSMTGYGRSEVEQNGRKVTLEISSVNHRYCDLNIRMPRSFTQLEDKIREIIKKRVSRGKIDVSIYITSQTDDDLEVIINEPVCHKSIQGLRYIAEKFKLKDDLALSHILSIGDAFSIHKKAGDLDAIMDIIETALNEALDSLIEMRIKEGNMLREDILNKLSLLNEIVLEIEKRSYLVVDEYKKKLEARLKLLLPDVSIDPSRIAQEVVIYADKCAIDEELTRLKSHISQIITISESKEPSGRKLDFLMQEMNREANTIGSKANDSMITNYVVELKTEIEKIREQVQNIE
jgi:uncharacterized protein (TIGR00255 family)